MAQVPLSDPLDKSNETVCNNHKGFYLPAVIALSTSVVLHLGISLLLVLVEHWHEPRILIPLAGMYFPNSMNSVSLAAERFHAELYIGKDAHTAQSTAFDAAMILLPKHCTSQSIMKY